MSEEEKQGIIHNEGRLYRYKNIREKTGERSLLMGGPYERILIYKWSSGVIFSSDSWDWEDVNRKGSLKVKLLAEFGFKIVCAPKPKIICKFSKHSLLCK